MKEKEKVGTIASVPLASYAGARARAGLVANARDEGGGGGTITSEISQISPLSAPVVFPSHFPIYIYISSFSRGHVQCEAARKQP